MKIGDASELVDEAPYVRFQSPVRNERGYFSGVFGLVNGLARSGKLSTEQERFRRANNDWYNAAYPDPSTAARAETGPTKNPTGCEVAAPSFNRRLEGYQLIGAGYQLIGAGPTARGGEKVSGITSTKHLKS
ncbi:hypothetical protein [Streptomyces sp. Inha503]|uniref:hypothetical protein n=1 Tax=Streptomyces sp. Inha503 TaxID=3383314 RepID=UPI00399FBACD